MNRFIPTDKAVLLLQTLRSSSIRKEYDPEKHRIALLDGAGNEQAYFRLPITLPYIETGRDKAENYVILLIQAGNCAVGYFENGRCLNHKVFRSYMVRKKQGKSQIKYLKTKGKSRAGSRVRLGETAEFFENINGRLQAYFKNHEVHRIAISCSKTLLPYLYSAKVSPPFDKHDQRLFKIPKHIHTPIYEVLLDANRFLLRGELIYEETGQALVEDLLADAGITVTHESEYAEEPVETESEEDWDEVYDGFDEEDEPDDFEEDDFDYLQDDEDDLNKEW
jgi:hypothetical protein